MIDFLSSNEVSSVSSFLVLFSCRRSVHVIRYDGEIKSLQLPISGYESKRENLETEAQLIITKLVIVVFLVLVFKV
jgi:hypothetical protein